MEIFTLDISPLQNQTTFQKLYELCPQSRKNKIDSLKSSQKCMQSLGAGYLLSHGMKVRGISEYNILTSPFGKPYAEKSAVKFSLSHSGKYAAAAFSNSAIGIDIEEKKEANLNLAFRFFSKEEQLFLQTSSTPETDFLKFWTRKEALFKSAEELSLPDALYLCTLSDSILLNGEEYRFSTFVENDFILSVAHLENSAPSGFEQILLI